eukprot:90979_1
MSFFALIGLILLFDLCLGYSAKTGPIWPNAYTVKAVESEYHVENPENRTLIWSSQLIEYYDWTNKRMRYDRPKGTEDGFCLMNVATSMECQLFFDSSGALYVNYPSIEFCCELCKVGHHCSVIKPNWIVNGTYDGQRTINNRTCDVWNEYGVTTMDYWSQDSNAIPCAFWEEGILRNLIQNMYDPDSYIVGEPDPSLFVLPSDSCYKPCNNTM